MKYASFRIILQILHFETRLYLNFAFTDTDKTMVGKCNDFNWASLISGEYQPLTHFQISETAGGFGA